MLEAGAATAEIAAVMDVSYATVRHHRRKLGIEIDGDEKHQPPLRKRPPWRAREWEAYLAADRLMAQEAQWRCLPLAMRGDGMWSHLRKLARQHGWDKEEKQC